MSDLYVRAVDELKTVFETFDDAEAEKAVVAIMGAKRIAFYACGRERLQIMGFCMRLYHMGFEVSMVGDMTTPPLGAGDLLFTVCGPGFVSTTSALIGEAKKAGAKAFVVTSQPEGATCRLADGLLVMKAQTMADDRGSKRSVLPMGSLFEGALFVLFEVLVLKLMEAAEITPEAMRARHTNLE